jgi:DNA-binding response OmpR family regulator/nitrogen-specific signal transduction histidine kinase
MKTALEVERIEIDKAREMDQMKSRFFANISHEFRTPLTLLLGPVNDLLKKRNRLDRDDRKLLGTMKRNILRLQQLINQLLDLSRLETGKLKLEIEEGDLTGFIRTLFHSFLSLAESKQIKYEYRIEETSFKPFFDRDKVEKIVSNLISNAMKFTPKGGYVSVRLHYIPEEENPSINFAEIRVSDSGPGIPSVAQDRIFDRFYQVNDSNNRNHDGTGIGLALVKELVEMYRGKIILKSEPGKGSTFIVTLPVSQEQFDANEFCSSGHDTGKKKETVQDFEALPVDESEAVIQAVGEDSHEAVILVVEDNRDLRKYISQNLQDRYRILEAVNGSMGLEKAIESIPDLVVSDLMMPEMDGMEMCDLLKKDHRTDHIPVIMLTARADRDSKLDSYKTGADEYMIKPFDAEELQVRVKNLIEQRKRLRERYKKEFLTDPEYNTLTEGTDKFLIQALTCLQKNLSNSTYNVDRLGQDLNLSQSQLYRKLVALTDLSPVEFIRNTRLKAAAKMFREGHKNISSVLYSVGFNTPSLFSRYFRELFGINPSHYIKQMSEIPD